MLLINCKVELSLTWNKNCILSSVVDDSNFAITDTKLYVQVVSIRGIRKLFVLAYGKEKTTLQKKVTENIFF